MSLPTVCVVDDDREFRDSLLALLGALGYQTVGYESGEQFLQSYDHKTTGCLLMDVRMPGQNGIDLYADMVRRGNRLPVIFVTAHADVSTAVAAMKTGAIEFLEKPFDRSQLKDLVDRALQLDREWRESDDRFHALDDAIGKLSPVDQETLQLIFDGATNKAMAARLFISERAVELRRQRLMRRLEVRSVAELLELAITHRVLSEIRTVREAVV
ncbi:MAG TPA: response regulator [Caulifigura sp.]|nr:response regulator [Caulifigura sp.]